MTPGEWRRAARKLDGAAVCARGCAHDQTVSSPIANRFLELADELNRLVVLARDYGNM